MATLLVKNAALIVTMDAGLGDVPDGAIFCRDGVIQQIGPASAVPRTADEVLDLTDHIVVPGLINTHHHLFQNLTRAVPAAQNASLFDWLKVLFPIWARIGPEHVYVSALVGLAEMALTGCTTSSDHLYMFPNGARLEDEIRAAQEIGIRFHAARGAMSVGESQGGLPPDYLVERETPYRRTRSASSSSITTPRYAMLRIVVAPARPSRQPS
jgi:cytosine/adenosine deaminase-related metal-dependent hydrolase